VTALEARNDVLTMDYYQETLIHQEQKLDGSLEDHQSHKPDTLICGTECIASPPHEERIWRLSAQFSITVECSIIALIMWS
jgi:hypothetical protein